MPNFEKQLTGGHPNSLGNTIEVVEMVLACPSYFENLFSCYFSQDEVVRLRVSNAMKRICKVRPDILVPYIDSLLQKVSTIEQASTQWTLATLFDWLWNDMTKTQQEQAIAIGKRNLNSWNDWIVLNTTMDFLGNHHVSQSGLTLWLAELTKRLSNDPRKSVSKKAQKWQDALQGQIM
ncbi:MAG: hypothetical protein HRU40_09385 [Saprospiraceae bacterium]|nr:hypothetical protein [Saprospiraceae bacterium]